MEHTGYEEESSEEAPVLILSWQSYRVYNSPNHDYKQTKTLPVIMIDSFQTSVTDVRCWKWYLETSQIITVSGPTHSCPYHYYTSITQYYSSTRKRPEFSLPCLACTHITRTLLLCCTLKLLLLFLRTSQTKSQPTVWPIADFLQVLYICYFNQYNTGNYQLMRIPTTIIMPAHQ